MTATFARRLLLGLAPGIILAAGLAGFYLFEAAYRLAPGIVNLTAIAWVVIAIGPLIAVTVVSLGLLRLSSPSRIGFGLHLWYALAGYVGLVSLAFSWRLWWTPEPFIGRTFSSLVVGILLGTAIAMVRCRRRMAATA